MRILLAKILVGLTGLVIVVLAVMVAAIRNPSTVAPTAPVDDAAPFAIGASEPTAETAAVSRGRGVYVAHRCRMCHAIDGDGNARSPLDDVGGRLTDDEIRRWIVAPQEMDPAVAKRGYQLSAEDLEALVAYLKGPRRP